MRAFRKVLTVVWVTVTEAIDFLSAAAESAERKFWSGWRWLKLTWLGWLAWFGWLDFIQIFFYRLLLFIQKLFYIIGYLTTRHSLHFISLISFFDFYFSLNATHKLFVNWEKKLTISRSPSRYNSAAGAAAVQPVSQPKRRRILAWLRSQTGWKY